MALKQKMEIKVEVACEKVRQIAMKIASQIDGVESVGAEGGKLVIIGTEICWIKLMKRLKRKLGCIQLITLTEVKPPPEPEPKPEPKPPCTCPPKPDPKPPCTCPPKPDPKPSCTCPPKPCYPCPPPCPPWPYCPPPPVICYATDSPCSNSCSFM